MSEGTKIGTGYIQVMPEMKDFTSAVKSQTESSLGASGKEAGNSFGSGLKKGLSVATAAATAAVGVIGTIGAVSINAGKEFDSAMSQVAATMGVTVDDIGELRDFAQEMGSTTAFSATQAADALNYMALAGYDANTSMEMLPTVLDLAAAGGIELARASDMVTDAQSALGLTTEETSELVDKMAKASSKSNTSVAQLGDAILKIGGTANVLSGGTTELATSLGILADNGIKGAEGGTHLRNILLSLVSPTDDASAILKDLGVTAVDSSGNMRPLQDIMLELGDSLDGLGEADKALVISKLFNKTDIAAVNALLKTNKGRWEELSGAIENSAGAAEAMANTQLDNLAGDITLFKSALEGAEIAISDVLTPSLREFVQFGTNAISDLTDAFKEDGLAGAMGVLGDYIAQGLQMVIDALPEMVDAAVELLGSLLEGIGDNIPQIADAAVSVITKLIEGAAEMLPDLIVAATTLASEVVSSLVQHLPEILSALWEGLKGSLEAMGENIEGTALILGLAFMKKFGSSALSGASDALSGVAGKITEALGGSGVIGIALAGIGVAVVGAITAGKALGQAVIDGWIDTELGASIQAAKDAISGLTSEFDSISSEYEKTLADLSADRSDSYTLLEWLDEAIKETNPSETLKQQIQSVVDELNEKWPELGLQYDTLTGQLNMTTGAIKDSIDALYEQARAAAMTQFVTDAIQNLANTRVEIADLKGTFINFLEDLNLNTSEGVRAVADLCTEVKNFSDNGMTAGEALGKMIQAGNDGNPVLAELAARVKDGSMNINEAASALLGMVDGLLNTTSASAAYDEEVQKSISILEEFGYSEEDAMKALGLAKGAVEEATPAIEDHGEAVEELAGQYEETFENAVPEAVDSAIVAVDEKAPGITEEFANSIVDGTPEIESAVDGVEQIVNEGLNEIPPQSASAGDDTASEFNDSIISYHGAIANSIDEIYQFFYDTLGTMLPPLMSQWGSDSSQKFNSGLNIWASDISETANSFANDIDSALSVLPGWMEAEGYNGGAGLYNGLAAWSGALYSLANTIAWNISSTIRAAFNSHSPSRVMMAIGEDVGEGLAIGISDGGELAIDAAQDVSYDIIDAASHYDYGRTEAAQASDESQLEQIIDILNELKNLKVVMDSGEVVGVLAPEMSDEFERLRKRQGRG